jgi:hypothetical protein
MALNLEERRYRIDEIIFCLHYLFNRKDSNTNILRRIKKLFYRARWIAQFIISNIV